MKKFISVLLCALMLAGAMSTIAFAETADVVEFGNADGSVSQYVFEKTEAEWVNGKSYIIRSGCTFVVPSGRVLNVPYNSSLTVEKGAHLVVNGQLNAVDEVHVYGKMTGENVTGQENVTCYVEFADLTASNVNLADKIDIRVYLSNENDAYGDVEVELDEYLAIADDGVNPINNSKYLPVKYNTYLYVRVLIQEQGNEDRFDDKLFPVKCNGVVIPFSQNACPILVTTGSEITYSSWVNDSTYYNSYTISLPAIDSVGYTVYGRNSEVGEVVVKHGQSFSFRVELEEEYNKSAYQVYVFAGNGWTDLEKEELLEGISPAVADSEGYFTITNITSNHTVYVQGVMENEMLDLFSTIFNIFRQIWEAISEIFTELFGEGGIAGLLGGLTQ